MNINESLDPLETPSSDGCEFSFRYFLLLGPAQTNTPAFPSYFVPHGQIDNFSAIIHKSGLTGVSVNSLTVALINRNCMLFFLLE